ncbi:N-acetylmuramoyl-L-alanine amidase [Sinanaerobacter chloroacetimidivorans]|uniref:N-acetylmuramoyl-L-alanine amidase n=1 Tax=Sinanaerobacter chloroacetimidivorans TaxID=2818044 RepID=A0A8J7W436_9FIRM|nr:N-acetylmuramoyl-L-alanine amidase [Sinanaerobacter chloroacetimidivorans]MBR0598773.1 N-acetylmuramoyl-L-alanine amidase [Sinanaerobacter chloroacetimidivorans]
MPRVYLNPSNREIPLINGGTEEYYMNLIADAMVPYLRANGIEFSRSNPGDSLSEIIEDANAGYYDLFLGLKTNEAPEELAGEIQGPEIYFFAYDLRSHTAAEIIANNLKAIYPRPNLVLTVPSKTMMELVYTDAVATVADLGYRDNAEEVQWIKDNIQPIARQLVLSLTEYFNIPFTELPNFYNPVTRT